MSSILWMVAGDSNSMLKEMRKSVKSVGTRPGTLYGICKVHKQQIDRSP